MGFAENSLCQLNEDYIHFKLKNSSKCNKNQPVGDHTYQ